MDYWNGGLVISCKRHQVTCKINYIYYLFTIMIMTYRIRGLFGGDFNLAIWQIFIGLRQI